jgi:sugar/nucleoside kinase (ribokinase family)
LDMGPRLARTLAPPGEYHTRRSKLARRHWLAYLCASEILNSKSEIRMSVLIVGTTALDSIKTPQAENPRLLGGSASHAAVAASFFGPVRLIGGVGEDFPKKYLQLYRRHGIDLAGLQIMPGKTFHWSGEYELNMNHRRTLKTELGVIETFSPALPRAHRATPFVLLANIAPALQHHVLDQMRRPKFVVADTMDLWLNIALPDLLRLLPRLDGFVLNDSEAQQLTREDNISDRSMSSSSKARTAPSFPAREESSSARRTRWPRWWTPPARAIRSWAA